MPTVALTTEQKQEAVDAVAKYGSQTEAAKALGLPRATFQHRYRAGIGSTHASESGLPGHCPPDYVIINDASIADLHIAVRRMLYTLEVPDAA